MAPSREIPSGDGADHAFGGDWTERKLAVVSGYLRSYVQVLKRKGLETIYVDAFAGTGYRAGARTRIEGDQVDPLFPDLAERDPQDFLEGSAVRALRTVPPFDRYVFIERDLERCGALDRLKSVFSSLAGRIEIRPGDANAEVQDLCASVNWHSSRAVLFLDPYGMDVRWETIRAVARTRAIDMWLLFPLGVGLNRLLVNSGDIPAAWQAKLDEFLGTRAWRNDLYTVRSTRTLFDEEETSIVKARMEVMANWFVGRLEEEFAAVAPRPAVLRNRKQSLLYLLCFTVGNRSPRAIAPALRIANHLLRGIE